MQVGNGTRNSLFVRPKRENIESKLTQYKLLLTALQLQYVQYQLRKL